MKLKYCCRNMKRTSSKLVYKTVKDKFPDQKQKKTDCLGCCKLCSKQCVVKAGKTGLICADSPEELYAKLKSLLKSS